MIISLMAAICISAQSDTPDTYGKSDAEILKMGGRKWVDFYASKAGPSTMNYNGAWLYYTNLASDRNKRDMRTCSAARKKNLESLDNLFNQFSGDMNELGSAYTGGGTMWTTIEYAASAEAEDTIYSILHPSRFKAVKHVVVSKTTRAIDQISKVLKKGPSDGVAVPSLIQIKKDLSESNDLYVQIVKIASTFSRKDSDLILGYCFARAKEVLEY